jgi:Fungal protein kinase
LLGHEDAVTKARVLHQDVSVGNILITDNGGILINWELSKWLGAEGLEVEGQKTEHSSSALYDKMRQPTQTVHAVIPLHCRDYDTYASGN